MAGHASKSGKSSKYSIGIYENSRNWLDIKITDNNFIKSKWSRSYTPIKIITIVTSEARLVEDAMRKLDAK
ncbi:25163_t:CDS:2, partial [Cetraspora pellucida]